MYKWYPLQLGKINYERKILDIVEIKYNIPDVFEDARGGSPGYIYENEIWFILHKSQHFTTYKKHHWNYQHFFAVFDRNMNLQKYSELFKLGTHPIEFCTGLIIKEEEILVIKKDSSCNSSKVQEAEKKKLKVITLDTFLKNKEKFISK